MREYVMAALARLGLEPQLQETTGVGTHNTVAAHVVNVLARLRGRNPGSPAILLAAHYDSVPAAPGAGDDGAAVAALLEVLRALRADTPLAHDVVAIFTDGEEAGLTGAAAFVREHPWAQEIAAVLNFEGRGTGGPATLIQTGSGNLDVVRLLQRVPGAVGDSLTVSLFGFSPNDTDVSEFLLLNRPALNFAFVDGVERYHSAQDDAEHLQPGSVQHHGAMALAITRLLGNDALPRPVTADGVFFTLPAIGLLVYSERVAAAIAVIAVVLVAGAGLGLSGRDTRWIRSTALGAAGLVASTAAGAGAAFAVGQALGWVTGLPLAVGWSRGFDAIGIVLLAVSLSVAGWSFVRQWASAEGAHTGALAVWMLIAVLVTWLRPAGSFLFVWPLIAVASASFVAARTGPIAIAILWAATILTLAIVVPFVYTTAVPIFAMTGPAATILGAFVGFTAWLLSPHLEVIARRARLASSAALVAAMAAFLIGRTMEAQAARYLVPSMVAYAVDADGSGAWLASLPQFASPGAWSRRVLGSSAHLVMPRTSSDGDAPEWLTRAIAGESATLVAKTARVAVEAPAVEKLADARQGSNRRLDLRVRPARDTYSIRLRALNASVLSASVDGRAIDTTRYRTRPAQWTLGYVDPPLEGYTVSLMVATDTPVELEVIARSLGLPAGIAALIPTRPPNVVPVQAGDQTVVYRRVRF